MTQPSLEDLQKRLAELTAERDQLQQQRNNYRMEARGPFVKETCPDPLDFAPRPRPGDDDPEVLHQLPYGLFWPPLFVPLNVHTEPELAKSPRLNILLPSTSIRHTSGGPNTLFLLAALLAQAGVPLRILSVTLPADEDSGPILAHMARISQVPEDIVRNIEVVDAFDRAKSVPLGENDVFFASAWWTAQMIKFILPKFARKRFVYMIQDFEPNLHPMSVLSAMALETYSLDHFPIINSQLLKEHMAAKAVGRFADADFAARACSFKPAVDRSMYHTGDQAPREKKRLLFYARPNAPRNIMEFGVCALAALVGEGVLDPNRWEIRSTYTGVSDQSRTIWLNAERTAAIEPISLPDTKSWSEAMRTTDVLLSHVLSPQPRDPPREGAACGALVATNTFEGKTQERLSAISPNIIAGAPTVEGVTSALRQAVLRADDLPARIAGASLALPGTWNESFSGVLPELLNFLKGEGLGFQRPLPQRR